MQERGVNDVWGVEYTAILGVVVGEHEHHEHYLPLCTELVKLG